MRHALVGLLTPIAFAASARAQNPVTELWPELDVAWQPARHQRTFLELSDKTEREGPTHQASIGLYQDYTSLPRFYVRVGYRETFSVRDASYRESRIVTEGTITAYSAPLVRVLNRTRAEFRFINRVYSYRVRDRVQVQRLSRAAKGLRPSPYLSLEPFYDSRYTTIARMEYRLGTEIRIAKPATLDLYYGRQNNTRGTPTNINALGITAKLGF